MLNITFDNQEKDFIRILQAESRAGAPEVKRATFEIARMHGYRVGRMIYGARVVTVPIAIKYDSLRDLQLKKEELAKWLIHQEAKELKFSDEHNAMYYAHYTSGLEHLEESPSIAKGELVFTCYDPFKYGAEVTGRLSINNTRGGVESSCIIRVIFRDDTSEFIINHTESGKATRIAWDFVPGDILEIDTAKSLVKINDNERMTAFDFRTEMFDILPGHNTMTTNVPNSVVEIRYQPRWL